MRTLRMDATTGGVLLIIAAMVCAVCGLHLAMAVAVVVWGVLLTAVGYGNTGRR